MCGLAGLICTAPSGCQEDHARLVGRMCDLQVHRGPDDRGVLSLGRVCLGSNRLSIIDLSSAGHMPMSNSRSRWIVYNGEIYNFQELRAELIRRGHEFHSRTDTEVVLRGFDEWGESCLDRLIGMFAFAIYDGDADSVTLVRDRFGKKPMYYTARKPHILFASELKGLLELCRDIEVNYRRLNEWSLYRNVDFGVPDTLFADVQSLPAGHLMEIRAGRLGEPRRYYRVEAQVSEERYSRLGSLSRQALTQELDDLIGTAVRDRLVSDVPVGTLCSGGIDSSLITAICARERPDVKAFNVALKDHHALDESVHAETVARSLKIPLFTYRADGEAFRNSLVRAAYHSDHPITHPNSVFFLKVAELARSQGVIVLLSGEAADELFGGYVQRYRHYRRIKRLQAWLDHLPRRARRAIALTGFASDGVPITEFSEYKGLLAHATIFIDHFARLELRQRSEEAYGFVAQEIEREVLGAMLADLTNFLGPLLRRLDRMTMAASVECRVPFLDHRLVHAAINLPLSTRLRGRTDKWVLKEAASALLPREIVSRKKVGFPLPLADYLAPIAHGGLFEDGFCLDSLGMQREGLMRAVADWRQNVDGFFNLLALELWGRLFLFRQPVEEVEAHLSRAATHLPSRAKVATPARSDRVGTSG